MPMRGRVSRARAASAADVLLAAPRGHSGGNQGPIGLTGTITYLAAGASGAGGSIGDPKALSLTNVNAALAGGSHALIREGDTLSGAPRMGAGASSRVLTLGSYGAAGPGIAVGNIVAPYLGTTQSSAVDVSGRAWWAIRDLDISSTNQQGGYDPGVSGNTGGVWGIDGKTTAGTFDGLIQNCRIHNMAVGVNMGGSETFNPDRGGRWTIDHCTIEDIGGTGVYVYGADFTVTSNVIRNFGLRTSVDWWAGSGQSGAQHGVYSRARRLLAFNNEVYSPNMTDAGGGYGQGFSPRARDNLIVGNFVHDMPDGAIGFFPDAGSTLWGTGRSFIRHNVYWRVPYLFYAQENGGPTTESWVTHNETVFGGSGVLVGHSGVTTPWYIRNIAAQNGSLGTVPAGTVSSNNSLGLSTAAFDTAPPATASGGVWLPQPVNASALIDAGLGTALAPSMTGTAGTAGTAGSYPSYSVPNPGVDTWDAYVGSLPDRGAIDRGLTRT